MKKAYFEYDLPASLPYLTAEAAAAYKAARSRVAGRMDRLETALAITGMDGPVFAAAARILWTAIPQSFDSWTAEQLAANVMAAYSPETPVFERLDFPNAVAVVDAAFTTTEEWQWIRHIGTGGSETAVFMGTSKWTTDQAWYYEKIGKAKKLPDDDPERQAKFDRGHFVEDAVIDTFCELTGAKRTHETRMFRSRSCGIATANPDDILVFPDGRIYVFEAKSSEYENRWMWEGDRIPGHYIWQMRQYPAVLDDDRIAGTYIGCLFTSDHVVGGKFLGCDYDKKDFLARILERDTEAEQALLDAEKEYWEDYILPGILPPDPEDPEARTKIMRTYEAGPGDRALPAVEFPAAQYGETVQHFLETQNRRLVLEAEAKELKREEERLAQVFMSVLGPATRGRGRTPDNREYEISWMPRKGCKRVDYDRLALNWPDAYTACVSQKQEGSRPFSLKLLR